MTIEQYFGDWSKVVDLEEADRIMKLLIPYRNVLCPNISNVFRAFQICELKNLRVVICGQDPYNDHREGKPVATGIAFANSADTPKEFLSPSLNVLRESVIDFTLPHKAINFDQSLEKWEGQGVLMLNSALTCLTGKAESHMLLWRPFMSSLLFNLSKYHTGIVYVLMGSNAQTLAPYINAKFNHVIKIRHPSYYARTGERMPSSLWKDINNILISQNGYGIEWYSLIDK